MITDKVYLGVHHGYMDGEPLIFLRDPCENGGRQLGLVAGHKDGRPLAFLPSECTGQELVVGSTYLGVHHGYMDGEPLVFIPCCGDDEHIPSDCCLHTLPTTIHYRYTYETLDTSPPTLVDLVEIDLAWDADRGFWWGQYSLPWVSGSVRCYAVRLLTEDCLLEHFIWTYNHTGVDTLSGGCSGFDGQNMSSCPDVDWENDLRYGHGPPPNGGGTQGGPLGCDDEGWVSGGYIGSWSVSTCSPFYRKSVSLGGPLAYPRTTIEIWE